ncbi:antibiotic biosynthesis monooxygenase [Limosilactobacillus sp. STM2_1]|uniref:Antibiotic biosynthesis monooxygenase n=1 Tax=Limosilactobacillus rudii TaxID=2759755 RepID=A0A7W3UJA0_9LACO|nr:antibiotic biosynthesis monooxygenase [Limosilactobacillus rudii]MBB1078497.1 antibiotic biosynthesis monooxygenase [Limosilactobacillus rudii]MBB1096627.1 antibiotic biosynthesis monooxygenase [Limosilactobacillus rudii]MCD7134178.1 antibiotic biosynthesis monooxygenase [Limosilactobacillus rudii]
MSLTVNLYYTGKNGSAQAFVKEMEESGIANRIRQEKGNERYEYFQPLNDPETVMLIDRWHDQQSLDAHHHSPMMQELAKLREKYDLHMKAERYQSVDGEANDEQYLRK